MPFFRGLTEELASDDIVCTVAAPSPSGEQSQRRDSASHETWVQLTRGRSVSSPLATLAYYGSAQALSLTDAVVVPAAGTCIDTHLALLRKRRRGTKVGLWGHIGSYVAKERALDIAIEKRQLKSADHVFAYTEAGASHARSLGVPADRVTAVQNTIDIGDIEAEVALLDDRAVTEFRETHGLGNRRVFASIGGLDQSKRVDFLASVLDHVWRADASVRFIVAGRGSEEHLLTDACNRGQVIRFAYVSARDKALIGRTAEGIVNPGRVGLIAVDALVLGLPVITTEYPYHAPEIEYLTEGLSRVSLPDAPEAFAAAMLTRPVVRTGHPDVTAGPPAASAPTLEAMVSRFADGVRAMLR